EDSAGIDGTPPAGPNPVGSRRDVSRADLRGCGGSNRQGSHPGAALRAGAPSGRRPPVADPPDSLDDRGDRRHLGPSGTRHPETNGPNIWWRRLELEELRDLG